MVQIVCDREALANQARACIKNSDLRELKRMFTEWGKYIFDSTTVFRQSLLFCAIFWLKNDFVDFLLNNGADVGFKSEFGSTYVHVAAECDNSVVIRKLVERGVSIDAHDDDGNTALHIAAFRGHGQVVRVLLELGASTNRRNIYFRDPAGEAVNQGQEAVAHQIQVAAGGGGVVKKGSKSC